MSLAAPLQTRERRARRVAATSRALILCLFTIISVDASVSWRGIRLPRGKTSLRIAQFTDLHYGEDEDGLWGPAQDQNSTRVMRRIVALEDPDLVCFSGDLITGNNIASNATAYWDMAVSAACESRTPFLTVMGNHDDLASGSGGTKVELLRSEALSARRCNTSSFTQIAKSPFLGSNAGVNYVVPVFVQGSDGLPSLLIFVLDSGGGQEKPNGVSPGQVEWMVEEQKRWNFSIPAILFVHIPAPAYADAYRENAGNFTERCWGMHREGGGAVMEHGDGGLIANITQGEARIDAIFVGHDHGNAWCCPHSGTTLCYGRHTGFGGYSEDEKPHVRGSRIIEFNAGNPPQLRTWVRDESGALEQNPRQIPLSRASEHL